MIDERRIPPPEVEFRVGPRFGAVLIASMAVTVVAILVAGGLQGSGWVVEAVAASALVVLVAFVARALFSSVAITSSGMKVKNALCREITATWDQIREFQIVAKRSVPLCRVTLTDGAIVKVHAFEWPGSLNVLQDVHHWLAQYDSPLRHRDRRWWTTTFRNDMPR